MLATGLVATSLAVAAGACLTDTAVSCADGRLCPGSVRCVEETCVPEEQFALCQRLGLADGDVCTLPGIGQGTCVDGDCAIALCGNGRREGVEGCDDDGRVDGDGCEANCLSDETCGNGHRDVLEG